MLRFSSIGDIVLTSPVLRCLKEQVNGIEIHFLTKKKFFGLLEHNPRISRIFTFDGSLSVILPKLKAENYDLIIDLHNNLRSNYLKLRLGKPAFAFDKLNLQKWLLVNLKKDFMPNVHIVERYLETGPSRPDTHPQAPERRARAALTNTKAAYTRGCGGTQLHHFSGVAQPARANV